VPGDSVPDPSTAFPNQLQSIVIRGDRAYLPNIAASPESPLQFQNSTEAYVNFIDHVSGDETDGDGAVNKINLHLGARDPEPGKTKLFFANPGRSPSPRRAGWATPTPCRRAATCSSSQRRGGRRPEQHRRPRHHALHRPQRPRRPGDQRRQRGQEPARDRDHRQRCAGLRHKLVSGNVSVVDLHQDKVVKVVRTVDLPPPGSDAEKVAVGAEMFFSSRGHFDRPAHATVSTDNRLSSEDWRNCASCHFEGLNDGVVWSFGPGPRKAIAMNGTFNPNDPTKQRILNPHFPDAAACSWRPVLILL
jgi:hypothetical protein